MKRSSTSVREVIRGLCAAAIIPALTVAAAPAWAQDRGSLDEFREGLAGPDGSVASVSDAMGSLGPDSLSQVMGSTGIPLFSGSTALGLFHLLGFSPQLFAGEPAGVPKPDPSITELKVSVEPMFDDTTGRYQRLKIAYPPMQRVIQVELYRSSTPASAPNLYLLDGVGSPARSGFNQWHVADQFKDENANLVIPTGGVAAMWADWNKPDPELGINKWETFLTKDLPEILQRPEVGLASNGKTAIGGISMGASAAVTLAAKHPNLYRGAFGISGCYGTDGLGRVLGEYTVASRGGDVTNMWGPVGGAQWKENDATILAKNLSGKPLYLSSATGAGIDGELEAYNWDIVHFTTGSVLEQAVNSCTGVYSRHLDRIGVKHTWDLIPQGMHNWWNFSKRIPTAWNAIKGEI